jgi:hypothetical protein
VVEKPKVHYVVDLEWVARLWLVNQAKQPKRNKAFEILRFTHWEFKLLLQFETPLTRR